MNEIDAVSEAFSMARKVGMPCYAIEGKYGWSVATRKPSLRFGKVWECHENGDKCHG